MKLLYEDDQIELSEVHLQIRKYYFPLASSKTILLSQIESLGLYDTNGMTTRWGVNSNFLNGWFPFDLQRKKKLKFIEIKLKGKKLRPCITPQEPIRVFNLLVKMLAPDSKQQLPQQYHGKEVQIELDVTNTHLQSTIINVNPIKNN